MDSQSKSSLLLQSKQHPNGSVRSGTDNPVFEEADHQSDKFSHKAMPEAGHDVSEFYLSTVDLDFERRSPETDDEDSDSNRSQHEGRLDHGSVGMDSRMEDFEGETDVK